MAYKKEKRKITKAPYYPENAQSRKNSGADKKVLLLSRKGMILLNGKGMILRNVHYRETLLRKKPNRLKGYDYSQDDLYFVT